jgi:cellobiose-specific phosphotransferase system component IIA
MKKAVLQQKIMQRGKKIDIDHYDFEKALDKITENPGTLTYGHHAGSALVKPEDKGKIKGRAVAAMHDQTDMQMWQIFEQMQLLAEQARKIKARVHISERIYSAQINFEPLINHTYHLYQRPGGEDVLSLVAPTEWGRANTMEWIATVKLLADHTWEIRASKEGFLES